MNFYSRKLIFLISIVLLGAGCITESWIGFYYPNGNNLSISHESPELSSYEECIDWVFELKEQMNPTGEIFDDYECGKGCSKDKSLGLYICDETIQ